MCKRMTLFSVGMMLVLACGPKATEPAKPVVAPLPDLPPPPPPPSLDDIPEREAVDAGTPDASADAAPLQFI